MYALYENEVIFFKVIIKRPVATYFHSLFVDKFVYLYLLAMFSYIFCKSRYPCLPIFCLGSDWIDLEIF